MNEQTKIEAADNVHRRLSRARQLFHATNLKKSGRNTFANYSYFELGDFIVPALQIFDEMGLGASPVTFADGYASMDVVNLDDPTDRLTVQSPLGKAELKGCHEVQNIGAVETYQRRYLWMAVLELVEHDALDGSKPAENPAPQELVTDADFTKIQALCQAVGNDQPTKIKVAYKVDDLSKLTATDAQSVIKRLNDKLAEAAKAETNERAKETENA